MTRPPGYGGRRAGPWAHLGTVAGLGLMLLASEVRAQVRPQALSDALSRLPDGGARFLRAMQSGATTRGSPSEPVSFIVETDSAQAARDLGYIPITRHLAIAHATPAHIAAQLSGGLLRGADFSPARHPYADVASQELRIPEAQSTWGLRGEGTIIGVIDTGADAAHKALRHEDGTSRIAWMLAFGQEPRGRHVALEAEYGCTGPEPCAVFSREDLDNLLEQNVQAALPRDPIGHGTHILSLAAGRDDVYPGVAPLADLVVVSAANADGGVTDARILLGTRFIFDRAEEMQQPAVANISLGSSFGAHDGSSGLERGLAALAEGPSRAVVVAAGNGGSLLENSNANYPGPFGVHTEVAVTDDGVVRVPLLNFPSEDATTYGSIFVWIAAVATSGLRVGFHNGHGQETTLIGPGDSGAVSSEDLQDSDEYDVLILNGQDEDFGTEVSPGSIVFALGGSFQSRRTFELLLAGRGTARIWVTGPAGDLSTVLPRARSQGTVAIPGTHPELITVGATVNRFAWLDWEGQLVGSPTVQPGLATFSAAGPNQLGNLKPEILGPGDGVIGAMSQAADPRRARNAQSQFASSGACPDDSECFVIDDEHGIASGTSMAAPLVSGALALLFQRDPELTMAQAKALLMAGANSLSGRQLNGGMGTGQLDVVRSLLAQEASLTSRADTPTGSEVSPIKSTLTWSDEFVHPQPGPPLTGYLVLRDDDGNPVVVEEDELAVTVAGPGQVRARIVGPGLAELALLAHPQSAPAQLTVTTQVSGSTMERSTIPIGLDPQRAEGRYSLSGGTCAVTPAWTPGGSNSASIPLGCALTLTVLVMLRRRDIARPAAAR